MTKGNQQYCVTRLRAPFLLFTEPLSSPIVQKSLQEIHISLPRELVNNYSASKRNLF